VVRFETFPLLVVVFQDGTFLNNPAVAVVVRPGCRVQPTRNFFKISFNEVAKCVESALDFAGGLEERCGMTTALFRLGFTGQAAATKVEG